MTKGTVDAAARFCDPLVGPFHVMTGSVLSPAGCVTVTPWPLMVRVPLRGKPVVLEPVVYETRPDPVPLDPAVMMTQLTALVAVQVQPLGIDTFTALVAPAAALVAKVGDTATGQGT